MSTFIRYSAFYFASVGMLNVLFTFLPLYFKSLGFSISQITWLACVDSLAVILFGPLAIYLAEHRIGATKLFAILAVAMTAIFMFLHLTIDFVSIFIICFLVFGLVRALLVLADTSAIRTDATSDFNFGRARLWGSIGFILIVYLLGNSLDLFGLSALLHTALFVAAITLISSFFLAPLLDIPQIVSGSSSVTGPFSSLIAISRLFKGSNARWFLLTVLLSWVSRVGVTSYISIYLHELGWSGAEISLAFNVGVFSEIFMLHFFKRLEQRFSLVFLLRVSVLFTALRWLILSIADSSFAIITSQMLHAFTFAGFQLASMRLMFGVLPEELKNKGQAILNMIGPGIGIVFGTIIFSFLAGQIPHGMGLNWLFLEACAFAIFGYWSALQVKDARSL